MQRENRRLRLVALNGHENVALVRRHASQIARIADGVARVGLLQLHGTQFNVVELSRHRSKFGVDRERENKIEISIIKRDFSRKFPQLTSIFSQSLCISCHGVGLIRC